MHELARVTLSNEMDLILAHKRSMKLAELAGLSLSAQTTFATAVSEVSRNTIDNGNNGRLVLSVESDHRDKYIVACLTDEQAHTEKFREGLAYARRLVSKCEVVTKGVQTSVELFFYISPSFRIDIYKLDEWRTLFRNEPPLSPYDELKRKNEQLLHLSEKVQKSETQYKTLTNSLPLTIFSLDGEGQLTYANEWLLKYTGCTAENINTGKWKAVIHEEDYPSFSDAFTANAVKKAATVNLQSRLKNKTGDYLWHQVSLSPVRDEKGELVSWTGFLVDIHTQKMFEQTLQDNRELKQAQERLKENQQTLETYIDELARSNRELQQFAFIASHDLQEPVRKLIYYSDYLLNNYTPGLDTKGTGYLTTMKAAAQRMRTLIQDLLLFSQVNKEQVKLEEVDLNEILRSALQDFDLAIEEKGAVLNIAQLPVILADGRMIQQLFANLLSNALKYARPEAPPQISITGKQSSEGTELCFTDNGIGFDEKYLPQLFTLFQRLHTRDKYEGTGLGLAICRRVVEMHGGKIWAKAEEGAGASFYVSLPAIKPNA